MGEEPVVLMPLLLLCGDGNPWAALVGAFLASAAGDSIPPLFHPHDALPLMVKAKETNLYGFVAIIDTDESIRSSISSMSPLNCIIPLLRKRFLGTGNVPDPTNAFPFATVTLIHLYERVSFWAALTTLKLFL